MIISSEEIKLNILEINEQIAEAAKKSGRNTADVALMAVTKTKPLETIQALLDAGQRLFGENYPEEIPDKSALFRTVGASVAMIGHLQSRKAKIVADYCDAYHSLDRLDAALKMEQLCAERERIMPVFLELNVGDEVTKSGWHFPNHHLPENFLRDFERMRELPHLCVKGLMTLPPYAENGEDNRVFFVRMRRIMDQLNEQYAAGLNQLSMGTSSDYRVAIEEGATIVRIGTALVGARDYKNRG